jgi:CRP-like cAMP-binding protein
MTNSRYYSKGDVLYSAGEDSDCLYLVVSGEVTIFSGSSKKPIPVNVIRDKDFLGEQSLFAKTNRDLHAVVSKNSEIMKIEREDVDSVLGMCHEWVGDILKLIGERLQSTNHALYEHNLISETDSDLSTDEILFFKKKLENYLKD